MNKKSQFNTATIALDIVGFVLFFVGGALIRFSKDEITAIIGGFVVAGSVAILSITRLIQK